MIATCAKNFRLRNLRQTFPGVGFTALSTAMPDATFILSRGRRRPQRRLRPRQPAAVGSNELIDTCYRRRRVRLRTPVLDSYSCAWHALVPQMAIDECSRPPSLRFRIEPARPARQTLRRSLVYGSRLHLACCARRRSAQCSLCRVAREDSVNRSRPYLEFYPSDCAQISCYRTLYAYVQLSVPVSRSSLLYLDRERARGA